MKNKDRKEKYERAKAKLQNLEERSRRLAIVIENFEERENKEYRKSLGYKHFDDPENRELFTYIDRTKFNNKEYGFPDYDSYDLILISTRFDIIDKFAEKGDPLMIRIKDLIIKLRESGKYEIYTYRPHPDIIKLNPDGKMPMLASDVLDIAYRMYNRTLTEEEYINSLNGKHPVLWVIPSEIYKAMHSREIDIWNVKFEPVYLKEI